MSWRPSTDKSIAATKFSDLWSAIESIYDNVADPAPLPRAKWDLLSSNYIVIRKGGKLYDADLGKRRLPIAFRDQVLGEAEVTILDIILNMEGSRSALVEGPRGAGKTSLLHYVEAVASHCFAENKPILIIFNGLQLAGLDGSRAAAEIEADYAQVIRGTLYETASRASPPVSDQLRRAAHLVENDKTQPGIREAFRELASTMEEADQKRIIVAFDNLDHLTSNT